MEISVIRKKIYESPLFSEEILKWIFKQNLWNIWVPESYGGLEKSLSEGLKLLKDIARIDGNLGWTVTLCSGANFFIGNMKPALAQHIFQNKKPVLGGSGGAFGTAEKVDSGYMINGIWKYATGAPYLTHFTLNAIITENGIPLKTKNNSKKIKSFVLPENKVEIIDDWNTMGLKATATCSFKVKDVFLSEQNSFAYEDVFLPQKIFKTPFPVFADLTLWVNYLGIAENYLEEMKTVLNIIQLQPFENHLIKTNLRIKKFAEEIEKLLYENESISSELTEKLHSEAALSIRKISSFITELHPFLGMRAADLKHPLNRLFRNYFTATQHYNFVK